MSIVCCQIPDMLILMLYKKLKINYKPYFIKNMNFLSVNFCATEIPPNLLKLCNIF